MNDDNLENTVTSLLSDMDVSLEPHDIEDCYRIGLIDKNNSKKTIFRLVNHRYCKKALKTSKKFRV